MQKYLSINAGSSSLKFSLYNMPHNNQIVKGIIEKIGKEDSSCILKYGKESLSFNIPLVNHNESVLAMLEILLDYKFLDNLEDIKGVGHRILHGGEFFTESVLIDESILKKITKLVDLGPLHMSRQLSIVQIMLEKLPFISHVAVFDTAFHVKTMPRENFDYSVPRPWYIENGVRKYGFHGINNEYVTRRMQGILGKKDVNLIVLHIGSGVSVTAVENGKSLNNSMGLTPLSGVMMNTRSGDIDPATIGYICKTRGLTVDEIINDLNKKSGLMGLSGGITFRELEKRAISGDIEAIRIMKQFENSIIGFIAKYYFELRGRVDAIVFTAGIGENSSLLRGNIVNTISETIDIKLNDEKNNNIGKFMSQREGIITQPDSKTPVYVIPANEEAIIIEDTFRIANDFYAKGKSKIYK